MNFRILVAEDEDITRKHLLHALKREGYDVVGARNGMEALAQIEQDRFDVLVTDIRMPEMNGIELLEKAKERDTSIDVLIITGFGSIDSAVEAMKKGAYEYITKPFNLDELIMKIKNLRERKTLRKENTALKAFFGMNRGVSIIARSGSMQKIISVIEGMNESECSVLLTGERGAGKSLLARIIHFTGRRRTMPFLSANCSSLPDERISEELFGIEEGSGGSATIRKGLLEIADNGTLFINDIAELPFPLQARVRDVIRDGNFFRDGGTKPVRANVRLISSSNRSLRELIPEGKFMEDLYYRLNTVEIQIPPLRERREDIEPLSAYFLQKHFETTGRKLRGFTREAMEILEGYSYPGNVRELENIIEGAMIHEKGPLITPESLPRSIKLFRIETFDPGRVRTLDEMTRDYAEKVLSLVEGDKVRAAKVLGISEMSLWRLLKGG